MCFQNISQGSLPAQWKLTQLILYLVKQATRLVLCTELVFQYFWLMSVGFIINSVSKRVSFIFFFFSFQVTKLVIFYTIHLGTLSLRLCSCNFLSSFHRHSNKKVLMTFIYQVFWALETKFSTHLNLLRLVLCPHSLSVLSYMAGIPSFTIKSEWNPCWVILVVGFPLVSL